MLMFALRTSKRGIVTRIGKCDVEEEGMQGPQKSNFPQSIKNKFNTFAVLRCKLNMTFDTNLSNEYLELSNDSWAFH